MSYLSCEITENNKRIQLITQETSTDPRELLGSLENFRQTVNETLTNMIKDVGEIDDDVHDDEDSSNDESVAVAVSPKKRRK